MIQTAKNYIYGTTAERLGNYTYKHSDDAFRESKVLENKKDERFNHKAKLKTVGFVLIMFAACFIIILRYSLVTKLSYDTNSANKIYSDIKNENLKLNIEIEKEMDLHRIRKIAEEKLGMQKPDKYQIVYVKVPKTDFTSVAAAGKNDRPGNDNMFTILIDKFGKFTHLLD